MPQSIVDTAVLRKAVKIALKKRISDDRATDALTIAREMRLLSDIPVEPSDVSEWIRGVPIQDELSLKYFCLVLEIDLWELCAQ